MKPTLRARIIYTTDAQKLLLHVLALLVFRHQGVCTVVKWVIVCSTVSHVRTHALKFKLKHCRNLCFNWNFSTCASVPLLNSQIFHVFICSGFCTVCRQLAFTSAVGVRLPLSRRLCCSHQSGWWWPGQCSVNYHALLPAWLLQALVQSMLCHSLYVHFVIIWSHLSCSAYCVF
jgi:hypothetical protein